jgi:D-alanyl-lipoteichoic acid acyltransferase DltB (MBOAT superfamily)
MKWFHEYIYISLGGNRRGKYRTLINICIVFLLSGLWHGASWTFVVWGLWGAITMGAYLIFSKRKSDNSIATLRNIPAILIVFTITTIGFIIFRSPSIDFALHYFGLIFTCGNLFTIPSGLTPLWIVLLVLVAEWYSQKRSFALEKMPSNTVLRFAIYWILLGIILWTCETQSDSFIYFRF